MEQDLSWVPAGVDTGRPSVARVYDYLLGGTCNVQADRDTAEAMIALQPDARDIARANRDFLGRAVRFLAGEGIRQFLDIGSGIPTQGNVHEIAQQAAPGSRVVYTDIDPVAVAQSRALLAGSDAAAVIQADLREPAGILGSAGLSRLIDLSLPVGLVLGSVLHFLADEERPWQAVATLRDALAPGSYLVLTHATSEGMAGDDEDALMQAYRGRVETRGRMRSRAEIARFFDGFRLVEPGLVLLADWRPDVPPAGDPARYWFLAGAGRRL